MVRIGPKSINAARTAILDLLDTHADGMAEAFRRARAEEGGVRVSISVNFCASKRTADCVDVDVKLSYVALKVQDDATATVNEDQLEIFEREPAAAKSGAGGSFEIDSDDNGVPDGWARPARAEEPPC